MNSSRTLAIIKPNAVESGSVGAIIGRIEAEGFTILGARMLRLRAEQAAAFYIVHRDRPFYDSLVSFMASGPVYALALERDDAVQRWRDVMGATNPADAADGTIRGLYGESIERNATHGSDSEANARTELAFFFSESDLL